MKNLNFKYSIEEAGKSGYKGMILFENPGCYSRFGFKNAKKYQITTNEGLNFDPFMALKLQEKGQTFAPGKIPADLDGTED